VRCPFCDQMGGRSELHAHMVQAHKDRLQTRHQGERMFFDVNCPVCSEGMTREVNPRGRDQAFLEKFADEIRMVGYDLLLYHWETHEESGAPVEEASR
jgi:hypothetical protein